MNYSNYLERSKKYKPYNYKVLNKDKQDYLHARLLDMLKAVINILDENDITYMACGGTLLGAYTLGKFIPWDDDIDLCIPEEQYEKAMYVLEKFLPENCFLQYTNTEKNYFHGWAKVRDKNSCVNPKIKAYKNNGIWIDCKRLKRYTL